MLDDLTQLTKSLEPLCKPNADLGTLRGHLFELQRAAQDVRQGKTVTWVNKNVAKTGTSKASDADVVWSGGTYTQCKLGGLDVQSEDNVRELIGYHKALKASYAADGASRFRLSVPPGTVINDRVRNFLVAEGWIIDTSPAVRGAGL